MSVEAEEHKMAKFLAELEAHPAYTSSTPLIFRGWEDIPAFEVTSEWMAGWSGIRRAYQGIFEGCPMWHPVIEVTSMAGVEALLISVEVVY